MGSGRKITPGFDLSGYSLYKEDHETAVNLKTGAVERLLLAEVRCRNEARMGCGGWMWRR